MTQLSKQEAETLLQSLPYEQWLTAGRMLMPSGIHKERLSSLKEVHWFLEPSCKTLPAVDFDRLADWLETALNDQQTAEQLRETSAASKCYVATCKAAHTLIGSRIEEAEGVLNHDLS